MEKDVSSLMKKSNIIPICVHRINSTNLKVSTYALRFIRCLCVCERFDRYAKRCLDANILGIIQQLVRNPTLSVQRLGICTHIIAEICRTCNDLKFFSYPYKTQLLPMMKLMSFVGDADPIKD